MRRRVDAHLHLGSVQRILEVERYRETWNFSALALISLPDPERGTFNPALLAYKRRNPDSAYVLGEFDYRLGSPPLVEQLRELYRQGFDGLKLILGKPAFSQKFGINLREKRFREVFCAAGEEFPRPFPVLVHVGDPWYFWVGGQDPKGERGAATASSGIPSAGARNKERERGKRGSGAVPNLSALAPWSYGRETPPFEEWVSLAEELVSSHPRTVFIFPHLLFLAHDLDRLERLLRTRQGVYTDLAPGNYFYRDLSLRRGDALRFFSSCRDRILFGTDSFFFDPDYRELPHADLRGNLERGSRLVQFLETTLPFPNPFGPSFEETPLVEGLGLRDLPEGEDILRRVYSENFYALFGESPRPLAAGPTSGSARKRRSP